MERMERVGAGSAQQPAQRELDGLESSVSRIEELVRMLDERLSLVLHQQTSPTARGQALGTLESKLDGDNSVLVQKVNLASSRLVATADALSNILGRLEI